ncbi:MULTISPECIES: hypothetical protein [Arthrobacter]|uniref:hypothetical protein n=1 Tax=Arthrobacter TaxID=1663 RepID=UPI0010579980|nr:MULTISPECIES: hypothetical protein [Arthrobacter]
MVALRFARRVVIPVLAGVLILPMTGCTGASAPGAVPTDAWTISPGPTAGATPAAVYSVARLRALVGSVRAVDGLAASVVDDSQLKMIQGIQSLGSSMVTTEPAECLDLLRAGSFSDDRIPTAAALLGPPAGRSTITASSDDSGLYWQGMYNLDRVRARCSPSTLILDGQSARYELSSVLADLHGRKATANVQTITDQNEPHFTLAMVAMTGNLFVTGSKTIRAARPTDAEVKELSGYINAVIDGAGTAIPLAAATDTSA